MILDAVPYRETLSKSDRRSKSLIAFTDLLERNLGIQIVKDLNEIPFSRHDLAGPFKIAALLKKNGLIQSFRTSNQYPDLPRLKSWFAICNDPTSHHVGGSSWDDDESALYATFSEALERYIWMTQDDYFVDPTLATAEQIAKKGSLIAPENFAGFTKEQRAKHPLRALRPDAKYLWIRGNSLTSGGHVYVPAQTVCGIRRTWPGGNDEPVIREPITNGLATWPTQAGARLGGIQELIERESYMIMWLNQMTLPRYSLSSLRSLSPGLATALEKSERYQFKVHALKLPTDAPTHAIAVVMEDTRGNAPRYTIGLKAHTSLSVAVEKAMSEALRANQIHRNWTLKGNSWDVTTPVEKIGHYDRLYFWGVPEHKKYFEFMVQGQEIEVEEKAWDNNSIEEHLQKLILWCKEKNFDCISVPLTSSAKNPTSLHVEMVIIPQLQPTYLRESMQAFGSTRWRDVPKMLGYTPRDTPFAERPHPFL